MHWSRGTALLAESSGNAGELRGQGLEGEAARAGEVAAAGCGLPRDQRLLLRMAGAQGGTGRPRGAVGLGREGGGREQEPQTESINMGNKQT